MVSITGHNARRSVIVPGPPIQAIRRAVKARGVVPRLQGDRHVRSEPTPDSDESGDDDHGHRLIGYRELDRTGTHRALKIARTAHSTPSGDDHLIGSSV